MMSITTSKRALKLKVLRVWTLRPGAACADLPIPFLFSFSTFFHVLGRDQDDPEPNGLLALPTQNQTLCCEPVPRQETIARIFTIGATELRVVYPSSCAQLPLESCVDLRRKCSRCSEH